MKFLRTYPPRNQRPQRGVTLIEALVALLVMSFGMVALVGLLGNLRRSGDLAKQRGDAMRIAQTEVAKLRSFSILNKPADAASGVKDYDHDVVALESRYAPLDNSNTTFSITRQVMPLVKDSTEPQAKTVRVTVAWTDRSGTDQSIFLDTIISQTDPVYGLALGVTPPTNGVRQPDKRNPVIPQGARDLGNGSSAFQPSINSTRVWIFNNVTGVITSRCQLSTQTANGLDSCDNNTIGYLVSGTVRFSQLATPDPSNPEASALPSLTIAPTLIASQFKTADGKSLAPGGSDYSPSPECFNDSPSVSTPNQTMVNYSCVVYPNSQRNWWGQVLISGLSIGTDDGQYKVCRYSGDYNGNGYTYKTVPVVNLNDPGFLIDNEEHPETYRAVTYSLARQNFLVVPGKSACPLLPADTTASRFVDYSTYQLQPPLPAS
ncbi:prepilin-type N-terminal cleavage/methylation domain-containing protein [Roseateles sp. BYS78W]|uniref:Prepilin-type N-terminal cleavage/methylation domain-containing protein n=1 Tax=Pelomonas candidula TaxID=3299025 RepID=A0ABW7HCS8_9BURK